MNSNKILYDEKQNQESDGKSPKLQKHVVFKKKERE